MSKRPVTLTADSDDTWWLAAEAALSRLKIDQKLARSVLSQLRRFLDVEGIEASPIFERNDDGALLVEVRLPFRRLGIAFEVQREDSGWYLVDARASQETRLFGDLSKIDVGKLLRTLK